MAGLPAAVARPRSIPRQAWHGIRAGYRENADRRGPARVCADSAGGFARQALDGAGRDRDPVLGVARDLLERLHAARRAHVHADARRRLPDAGQSEPRRFSGPLRRRARRRPARLSVRCARRLDARRDSSPRRGPAARGRSRIVSLERRQGARRYSAERAACRRTRVRGQRLCRLLGARPRRGGRRAGAERRAAPADRADRLERNLRERAHVPADRALGRMGRHGRALGQQLQHAIRAREASR
ncbi:hypothetical protein JT30_5490 [Burkholderia pseudomallei]|nr:hypothetical protein JT30_5490 [Burkholderia pseudomallei]